MKRLLLILSCLFLSMGLVVAQTTNITGSVVDETGEPVIGASILVKGTSTGTATDVDGNFTLSVPAGGKTLVVSYVGMDTKEVTVARDVKVTLKTNTTLDDVMVVAYGTAKKSQFTGSATQVAGERISMKNPSEISKALAGEVAGMQVINTSGQPGTNATIRIRGFGSKSTSNAPLYVVDGIPFGGDLSGIDPNDIESTTVLKDASATALYGTRAASGVIVITTKKGIKGKTRIEADLKTGASFRMIPLYNTIESPETFMEQTWGSLKTYAKYGLNGTEDQSAAWATSKLWSANGIDPMYNMWDTDDIIDPATGLVRSGVKRRYNPEKWSDEIFRTGQKHEASVKISGGSANTTHFTSIGYLKDEGYYMESDFERFSARSNIDHQVSPWLKSNINMAYSYSELNNPGQTDDQNNGFQFVNFMPAIYPVFQRDANGDRIEDKVLGGYKYDYGDESEGNGRGYALGINPAGAVKLDKKRTFSHQVMGNGMLEARFLNDFKFTANLGLQYLYTGESELTNRFYGDAKDLGRIAKENSTYIVLTGNQILSYSKQLGDHNFDAFVAHESFYRQYAYGGGQKSLLIMPNSLEWSNAVIMGSMYSDDQEYALESYFGQIRYDYLQKYFFNGSIRRDGSSRFADGNKWGTFGSLGGAWLLTKEDFLSNVSWLKTLKYKASWGVLGNQDFLVAGAAKYYPTQNLWDVSNMMDNPSFSFVFAGNPDLTWEKSYVFNTGFEFNINNILEGEVEYYDKTTKDMLYLQQVAPSTGIASRPVNDGEMRNRGYEFTLTGHVINTRDWKLDVRVNGGHYKNEMTKMPIDIQTGKEKPYEVAGRYAYAKGHSIYDFYIREYAGVSPETGMALYNAYYDVKEDGSRTLITDMERYRSVNDVKKMEVETTSDWSKATQKFVDKSAMPDLTGGFGFSLTYKDFDLSATFVYSIGGYAYDGVYATLMGDNSSGASNWHKDIQNRWKEAGDITDVPRLFLGRDDYTNSTSTRFLTDRSYLNLNNLRLGYTLPKSLLDKVKLSAVSLYVTGDNLFLLTARDGFAPMSSESGASDRSMYVPLSTVMGGIKVVF